MKVSAISLVCFVASLLPVWFAVKRIQLSRCARAWVSTKGKVIRASVEPEGSGDGFKVHIRYEFETGGKKYDSNTTDLGLLSARCLNRRFFLTESGANAYASEILAAPNVQIWFDPNNPSQSLLNRSFPVLFIAILIVSSVALVALGLFFL